ncbi:MAG: replication initiator protein [Microviridae sp.]|nr:MAG: replication initiator protein [Microviridae sp.]
MSCTSPISAFRLADRPTLAFHVKHGDDVLEELKLPCNWCASCRIRRCRDWSIRVMHEASLYDFNAFVTLTYRDEFLPDNRSLDHSDFQKFMKRLRKIQPAVRFYMCGEYGEHFDRPHFHACLFNCNFADRRVWKRTPAGSVIYRSATLERLWPFGYSSIGDVTAESAAYVAGYVHKKITGDRAESHYESIHPFTGEVFSKHPEYNRMSTGRGATGGIGRAWYDKFGGTDVHVHDGIHLLGKTYLASVPKYYDKLLDRIDPDRLSDLKAERQFNALSFGSEYEPEFASKRLVADASLSIKKRILE